MSNEILNPANFRTAKEIIELLKDECEEGTNVYFGSSRKNVSIKSAIRMFEALPSQETVFYLSFIVEESAYRIKSLNF